MAKEGDHKTEVMLESHDDYNTLKVVNPGGHHLVQYEVESNEWYEYSIYTNFTDSDHLPHDWSFVVWSDEEPVTILINDVWSAYKTVTSLIKDSSYSV